MKKMIVAPLSNTSDICGTFTLVAPILPFHFILRNICLFVDSIMANTYSTFCSTQANGPASYIRRIDESWFFTTLSLLLLDQWENAFIPWLDEN